ncbi:MAG TPA: hypothetical protein VID68_09225 [Solirubrobacteraceae bacterium]|jgi:hypothetical protein
MKRLRSRRTVIAAATLAALAAVAVATTLGAGPSAGAQSRFGRGWGGRPRVA